jgi:hypothetical protein
MTDDKQGLREPVTQDRRRRCPTCAAFTRLLCSMLTPRRQDGSSLSVRAVRRAQLERVRVAGACPHCFCDESRDRDRAFFVGLNLPRETSHGAEPCGVSG